MSADLLVLFGLQPLPSLKPKLSAADMMLTPEDVRIITKRLGPAAWRAWCHETIWQVDQRLATQLSSSEGRRLPLRARMIARACQGMSVLLAKQSLAGSAGRT